MAIAAHEITRVEAVDMLRKMWRIRHFETKVIELFQDGQIRGSTHTYIGMEASAVGACSVLRADDYITATHRGHGHCIAKGGRLDLMMAELLGKVSGYCKGKGGSMHIADVDAGILGANGIVGGGIGIATGAALSAKLRGNGQICVCFFGDGGFNQGALYECANMAAIWKLPVVYLCENNKYAMSTPVRSSTAVADLSARASAFGMPGINVDGMDAMAVREAVFHAAERGRRGDGPTLVVTDTYRYEGHNVGDGQRYRGRDEVDQWRDKDPIEAFRRAVTRHGLLDDITAAAIEAEVQAELAAAMEFANASADPAPDTLEDDVYA
ncbi:MAG: thiamine pyrophosphate-dependent dehydrogenase E1 component subunit alpha [Chloroflexota bacterium]|nr:MAG: thiamine pyrophosphate-dependent dehydrogenase E1 component subunit alpha [Chloroflexota bacterium]